jgi:probable F420-dependent oxidoreductase
MRFGFIVPNLLSPVSSSATAIKTSAQLAEAVGFATLWTTDHILMPEEYPQYGQGTEAIATIAYLAGVTERIGLGLSVLILPMRNPLVVAKQIASIIHLSGREFIVGIGVGWNRDEYGFLNADFTRRGKLNDEYITILRKLWSQPSPEHSGTHTFSGVLSFPTLDPLPSIWIGGSSDAALKRAATLGDGFHPNPPEQISDYAAQVAHVREIAGERPITMSMRLTLDVRQGTAEAIDHLHQLQEAGLEYPAVNLVHDTLGELVSSLEAFGRDVMPAFQG